MAQIEMQGFPESERHQVNSVRTQTIVGNSIIEDIESEEIENVRRVQVTVTWLHKAESVQCL